MPTSRFLDEALPLREPADARWIWATVTQTLPLRIRLDGDTVGLPITPDDLSAGLRPVGQRVYCQIQGRRLVVVGPAAGNGPLQIATGVDLNDVIATGDYYQYSNTNATPALNYPEANAGLLEVWTSASGTRFTWQRYTAYRTNAPNVYQRTNYAGTWGPWYIIRSSTAWTTVDVQQMITTTGITATTTDAQVGQAINMDCKAGDKVKIETVWDVTAGAVTFIGKILSNGASPQTGEAHIAGSTATPRATIAQNYLFDLTSDGARAFTMRASTTTGTAVVSATHTRMTATLLRQI